VGNVLKWTRKKLSSWGGSEKGSDMDWGRTDGVSMEKKKEKRAKRETPTRRNFTILTACTMGLLMDDTSQNEKK